MQGGGEGRGEAGLRTIDRGNYAHKMANPVKVRREVQSEGVKNESQRSEEERSAHKMRHAGIDFRPEIYEGTNCYTEVQFIVYQPLRHATTMLKIIDSFSIRTDVTVVPGTKQNRVYFHMLDLNCA